MVERVKAWCEETEKVFQELIDTVRQFEESGSLPKTHGDKHKKY